jgi:ribA/ribD-fused uncharacterized protein
MPQILFDDVGSMKKQKSTSIKFYHDTGEWGFLSPMYLCKIKIDGVEYKSPEHYYQSGKAATQSKREWIMNADTAYEAKIRSHTLKDTELVTRSPQEKIEAIRRGFIAKFTQNPELGEKLLATGDAMLFEDSPDDLFWGIKGENWIGKLVMEAREIVKKGKA